MVSTMGIYCIHVRGDKTCCAEVARANVLNEEGSRAESELDSIAVASCKHMDESRAECMARMIVRHWRMESERRGTVAQSLLEW